MTKLLTSYFAFSSTTMVAIASIATTDMRRRLVVGTFLYIRY